jgi:hypothetical protein
MPLESLFSTIAEAAFDYLLQESGLANGHAPSWSRDEKFFVPIQRHHAFT